MAIGTSNAEGFLPSNLIAVTNDIFIGMPISATHTTLAHLVLPKKGLYLVNLQLTVTCTNGAGVGIMTPVYVVADNRSNITKVISCFFSSPSDNYTLNVTGFTEDALSTTIASFVCTGYALRIGYNES